MIDAQTLLAALIGGILPALVWLWFWLKEDSARPEPRGLITFTFIAGMAAVLVALPLEKLAFANLKDTLYLIAAWALIEETVKWGAAYAMALKTRFLDEPIDCIIYLITAALGFAGLENALFLATTIQKSGLTEAIAGQNLRFVGASLLHVIASSSIGIAMALSFYRGWFMKKTFIFIGLLMAVLLHTLFNYFIVKNDGNDIFTVFGFVWVVVVIFLLIFEKIKRMGASENEPIHI
ncbi:PrsW family intramembrane metalloprotease [Candidatus Parcubacteria bacterium]|nr:PrsW family intramembrane metalloprotease [Candidatus Parcubacteria bacterium]